MSTALQSQPTSPPAPITPAPAPPTPAAVPAPTVVNRFYRLTVAQYHAMADAGILGEKDRVVLLEGLLVAKMTKPQPHIVATGLTQDALTQALPVGWYVESQEPITIEAIQSAPEPDVKVVRGTRRDYRNRRVTPADVALVVEVADSSVREDQTTMKAIYAAASIPFYWLLNLPANRLEAYSDPTGPDPTPDYRHRTDLGADDVVPLILGGQEVARIAVRDLLP
jgi:Uma2 family endonuclease